MKSKKTIMGKPDLQLIVNTGYQATTDLPMALYYEQIMEEFPIRSMLVPLMVYVSQKE